MVGGKEEMVEAPAEAAWAQAGKAERAPGEVTKVLAGAAWAVGEVVEKRGAAGAWVLA